MKTYQDGIRDAAQWLRLRALSLDAQSETAEALGLTTEHWRLTHEASGLRREAKALESLAPQTPVGDVEGRG